jgi:hypothetical protein
VDGGVAGGSPNRVALPGAWTVWDDALGRGGVVQLLLAGLGVVDRDLPVVGEVAAAA